MKRRFVAAHSEHPDLFEAAAEVLADVGERLEGDPSLAVVFASGPHKEGLADMARGLNELVGAQTVLGVSASGVVNGGREVESGPGLSLWVGDVQGVQTVRMETIDSGRTVLGLPDEIAAGSILLILADPFSFSIEALLATVQSERPDVLVVGGMASAGRASGENTLVLDSTTFADGAVGVILPPGSATTVVSQGCRPVGQPWVVTDGSGQMIRELGGERALDRLQPIIDELSPEDRQLAARGLLVGIVANEQTEKFSQGDFLIRSLMGADRDSGALAIGDNIEVGQVVQFHVRDAQSATTDLLSQLALVDRSVEGALLFTCLARGTHMFPEPHHDAQQISEIFPEVANAGMFCAAEIGPVGNRNAVHAYTATMLLF